jgi:hypothetical protein
MRQNCPLVNGVYPFVQESFIRAFLFTKEWFAYPDVLELDLWMAPEVIDLQYMTCLPCHEDFFCAPGSEKGRKVIFLIKAVIPLPVHI